MSNIVILKSLPVFCLKTGSADFFVSVATLRFMLTVDNPMLPLLASEYSLDSTRSSALVESGEFQQCLIGLKEGQGTDTDEKSTAY